MDSLMLSLRLVPHGRLPYRFGLLVALLPGFAAPAIANGPVEGLEMHRMGAGTLGPDGWTTAASTNGGYSVRLPCLFNDFTFRSRTESVTQADVLGCGHDGMKFMAMRGQDRDAAAGQMIFERPIPSATSTRFTYRGLPGIAHHLQNATSCAASQSVRTKAGTILLSVETSASKCEAMKQVAATFFASLEPDAHPVVAVPLADLPALPECPLAAALSKDQLVAAFNALPRDAEELMPADTCLPATSTRSMFARVGVCMIGTTRMNTASLSTLATTGEPVATSFMGLYAEATHSALKTLLEERYPRQPLAAYRPHASLTWDVTTVVAQPSGPLVILSKPSEGSNGVAFSLVRQYRAEHTKLVNRNLNDCR